MKPEWLDEVKPDFDGPAAKLWRIKEPERDDDPRWKLHIDGTWWLIYAPNAHPYWDWHLMMVQKLLGVDGVEPPIFHYAKADYELAVFALDPELPAPDPRGWPLGNKNVKLLEPADACVQFHGPTDDQLVEMIDKVAEVVADGTFGLIPDTDYHRHWTAVIQKTAEHYRGHPEHN